MSGRRGSSAATAAHQSDEEQEIDIESDDDDIGSPLGGRDGVYDASDKKAHHNALERKRRDHIKESFISLRDSLPPVRKEKVSRAQILQQATEYIQYMTKKNNNIRQDIETMKRQNQELKQKVSVAERGGGGLYMQDSPPHTPVKEEEVTTVDEDLPTNKRIKVSHRHN